MLTKDGREIRTAIEEAVYVVLGGPTKASLAFQCSNAAVHALVSNGFTHKRSTALDIEEVTAQHGCRVPAAELMALVPWQGPERHPGLRTTSELDAARAIGSTRRNATAAVDAVAHTLFPQMKSVM